MVTARHDYTLDYQDDAGRLKAVKVVEDVGDVIIHDNHYFKTVVGHAGIEAKVFDHGELLVCFNDPRPKPPKDVPLAPWDDDATIYEKVDRIARHLGLKSE